MLSWQIVLYIFASWVFYSLMVMGFGFILRSVKFFNVAYGGAFLVGGYMMFLFYRSLGIVFILALLLSLLASCLYMYLSYKLIFATLLRRGASNFVLLITSFGLLTATAATLGMIFGSQSTLLARHLSDVSTFKIFGGTLNLVQVVAFIVVPILVFISAYVIYKTRFGRALRAVEDDSEVAELVGIPKEKIIAKIFFISGLFGGLGGIGEGFDVGVIPASGLFFILPIVVITILGGVRSFWGGILGAFVLAIVQRLTVVFLGGSWEQAVPFVLLIIVLLLRPEGILKR